MYYSWVIGKKKKKTDFGKQLAVSAAEDMNLVSRKTLRFNMVICKLEIVQNSAMINWGIKREVTSILSMTK